MRHDERVNIRSILKDLHRLRAAIKYFFGEDNSVAKSILTVCANLNSMVFGKVSDEEQQYGCVFVGSSLIRSIGYYCDTRVMDIEFQSGALYRYDNVPMQTVFYFLNSPVKYNYYEREIEPNFVGVRSDTANAE